ncbi:MAG: S-layer homology domain-containing protein [Clostridia bacterium]|nr:S-layer homology domain-containing protein [Clostridia bacterium]
MKAILKKTFVFILTLSFVIASVPSVTLAKTQVADCQKEFELLQSLNLISSDFAESFKPSKTMSRGEFASLCTSVLNLKDFDGAADIPNPFADVLDSYRYYGDILEVYSFGLMSGDGTGKFNPDEKITADAVIKVVTSALGYDKMASSYGGYPYGYRKVANECKILDGAVLEGEYITSADIIIIFANALNTNIFDIESVSGDSVVMGADENKTLLSLYHGIRGYTDILNAVYGKQTVDGDVPEKNQVMLGDRLYKVFDGKNYASLFGHKVDFYVDTESEDVVAITDRHGENSSVELLVSDVEEFTDTKLTYYDEASNKEKTLSISGSATVVYNGRRCVDYLKSDFTEGDGKIVLTDNDGDKKYDIIDLMKNVNYVVSSASSATETVYDMYGKGSLYLGDLDNVVFSDEFGETMNLDELFEYDVLSVCQSKDKLVTSITYSNTETEGMLSNVSGKYATVGEKRYVVAENFKNEILNIPPHSEGIFVLDINGSIASFKSFAKSYRFGYVVGINKTNTLDSSVKIKILNSNGEYEIFEISDKPMLDGKKVTKEAVLSALSDGEVAVQQPLRYLEVSGVLRSADTLSNGTCHPDDDCFRVLYKGYNDSNAKLKSLEYNSKQMIFGGKVAVNDATKVFVASAQYSSNEEDFSAKTRSMFTNQTSYYINAFTDSHDSQFAKVIVYYGTAKRVGSSNDFMLVDTISRTLNEEGDEVYKISGLRGGKYVEYPVLENSIIDDLKSIVPGETDKHHTFKCGDVIEAGVNATTGKITAIYLYYDVDSAYARGEISIGDKLDSDNRTLKANVYSADGSNLWLTQNPLDESGTELSIDDIESINAGLYKIYVYSEDRGKPEVRVGTLSDVLDYKSAGGDFSKVVTFTDDANPGLLVVYR